jgi:hypothetical protein
MDLHMLVGSFSLSTKLFSGRSARLTICRNASLAVLLCATILALKPLPCVASSILQLSFDQLVTDSQLIFSGEVIESQAQWDERGSRIDTLVTFKVEEIIKGDHESTEITLSFAGGEIGQVREQVEGMVYPKTGEEGIYFVESTEQVLVNPLVGWRQGHFRRVNIDGVERIFAVDGRAVKSISIHRDGLHKEYASPKGSASLLDDVIYATRKSSALSTIDFIEELKLRISRAGK